MDLGGSVVTHPERPAPSSLLRRGSKDLAVSSYFDPTILGGLRVASLDWGVLKEGSLGHPPDPRISLRRRRCLEPSVL